MDKASFSSSKLVDCNLLCWKFYGVKAFNLNNNQSVTSTQFSSNRILASHIFFQVVEIWMTSCWFIFNMVHYYLLRMNNDISKHRYGTCTFDTVADNNYWQLTTLLLITWHWQLLFTTCIAVPTSQCFRLSYSLSFITDMMTWHKSKESKDRWSLHHVHYFLWHSVW